MKEFQCLVCHKRFYSQESLEQHNRASHVAKSGGPGGEKKKTRKYAILIMLLLAAAIFSYTFYLRSQKPGGYDDFARCLTTTGAVVYGNDFCQYTTKQLNFFGKSRKYLDYVKCVDSKELCDTKGVKITPTWEIKGKMYEQVQGLEKLSTLTGCKL